MAHGGISRVRHGTLEKNNLGCNSPVYEGNVVGFRVASSSVGAIPEPASILVWFWIGVCRVDWLATPQVAPSILFLFCPFPPRPSAARACGIF